MIPPLGHIVDRLDVYSRDEWDEIVEIGPDNGLIARLRAAAEWRRDARS